MHVVKAFTRRMITLSSSELYMLQKRIRRKQPSAADVATPPHWFKRVMLELTADVPTKHVLLDAATTRNRLEARSLVVNLDPVLGCDDILHASDGHMSGILKTAMSDNARMRKQAKQLETDNHLIYNEYACLTYMLQSSLLKFAVLSNIFKEIKYDNDDFAPHSMLDYGSDIGSALWAAEAEWKRSPIRAVLCCSSAEMNNMCRHFQRENIKETGRVSRVIRRRQKLANFKDKHDLCIAAFSLLENKTMGSLKQIILDLTESTARNGYLVLVECGSQAGFDAIAFARKLFVYKKHPVLRDFNFVSPCPHALSCPAADSNHVCISRLSVEDPVLDGIDKSSKPHRFNFCYLVVKNSHLHEDNAEQMRLVRLNNRSSRNSCTLCLADGTLCAINRNKKFKKLDELCFKHNDCRKILLCPK